MKQSNHKELQMVGFKEIPITSAIDGRVVGYRTEILTREVKSK